jgi:hypothetical protein
MIHNHWLSITHHDSQPLAQNNTPSFTTTASHGVLFWDIGCESWCTMLGQWVWIVVCYAEPVVVNHGVLFWASGCESWWVMLSQWLWIIVSDDEQVVVNHDLLCWASVCESLFFMLSQWLWIMVYDTEPEATWPSSLTIIHNHWLSITHHDSQPLAQNNTPWFTTTGSA